MYLMFLLPLGALLILILIYAVKNRQYKNTDYYAQTKKSYFSVLNDKGSLGEYYTYKYLKDLGGYKKYLFNCYVPKENEETTEIDVILLHESGIYVFESKNYSGWIFGNETQKYWTQTLPSGKGKSQKVKFFNPIMQNNLHIRWLKKLTDDETLPFYSYIVFSDRCELKNIDLSSDDKHVIKRYDILSEVNKNVKNVGTKLTNEKIDELYNTLYPLTQADAEQKLKYIEDIKKKYDIQENKPETVAEENKAEEKGKLCPKCGGKLVLRTTKNGEHKGEKFWGCSNFPKCRYIEKI